MRTQPHRKPRRASARGFPADVAAMAAPAARHDARRRARDLDRAHSGAGARVMSAQGEKATLKIRRGVSGETPRFETYDVPFEHGASVLDGLRWLRINKDPSIDVRYARLNANACKE